MRFSTWPALFASRPRRPARRRRCALALEALEDRSLLAVVPVGLETLVNTSTSGDQVTFADSKLSTASDAAGNTIAVWTGPGTSTAALRDVYAQRFDAAGNRVGTEFRVNTVTNNEQTNPAVAMAPDGTFVVTWRSVGQEVGGTSVSNGVFARVFSAAGVPLGNEFQVNTYVIQAQNLPSVAMDGAGNFVVSWQSDGQDGTGWSIYARRFDRTGQARDAAEFRVNTVAANDQINTVVAMNDRGAFVVAWQSVGQEAGGSSGSNGIFARLFSAAGVPEGAEFQVNTVIRDAQVLPSVAMSASGSFVVAWQTFNPDDQDRDVAARLFNATGVPQGAEFAVTTSAIEQGWATVDMDAVGNFLVTWNSNTQDGSGWGVYAQLYNASARPVESEFRVNSTTLAGQVNPSVTLSPDGRHVAVLWSGSGERDSSGVYGQWFHNGDVANTFNDAQSLQVLANRSITQKGTIDSAGDVDVFRFVAPVSGLVRIQQRKTTGSTLDSILTIYDAAGKEIASDDDSGGNRNSLIHVRLEAGQTYYLRAAAFQSSTGDYELSLQPMPDLVGEVFDVSAPAAQWGTVVTLTYTIRNQGNASARSFVISPILSADSTITRADILLAGSVLVQGIAAGRTVSGKFDVRLPDAPPAGFTSNELFLGLLLDINEDVDEIDETNNSSHDTVVIADSEVEPNNDRGHAVSIGVNSAMTGQIATVGDVDVYRIDLATGGYIDITAQGSSLDAQLALAGVDSFLTQSKLPLGGGGLLLTSDDQSASNRDPRLRQYLGAGTYYIAVSSAARGGAATGDYRLTVRFDAASNPDSGASPLPAGADPRAVISGDFNRDGILDLATANRGSGDVTVYLGKGDGSFGPGRRFDVPDAPTELVALDFNGDGRSDLATIDVAAGFASILFGLGNGAFAPTSVQRLALSDPRLGNLINRTAPIPDGGTLQSRLNVTEGVTIRDLDVIVNITHPLDSDLTVFLVAPDGTRVKLFADVTLAFSVYPSGASVEHDFRNTVFDDEATPLVEDASTPERLRFRPDQLLSAFDRKFAAGQWTLEVRDGATNRQAGTLVSWSLVVNGQSVFSNYALASADFDFNRDGNLDHAEITPDGVRVATVVPVDSRALIDLAPANLILLPEDIDPPDVDLSPQKILVQALLQDSLFLTIDHNPAEQARATPILGDLNGDGIKDVVLVDDSGNLVVRYGLRSPGKFAAPLVLNADRTQNPDARAVAILREGKAAVLVTIDLHRNALSLYSRQADGSWQRSAGPSAGLFPVRLAAGDLNGDGVRDLVVANAQFGSLSLFVGQEEGGLQPVAEIKVGANVSDVVLADVDRDGALDILLTDPDAGTVSVLNNRTVPGGEPAFADEVRFQGGTGEYGVREGASKDVNALFADFFGAVDFFPRQYTTFSAEGTQSVVSGDFNRDGVLDLVVTNRGSNTMSLLLGKKNAPGSYVDPVAFATGFEPSELKTAQLNDDNGDGRIDGRDFLDLIVLNQGEGSVSVFRGDGRGGFTENRVDVGESATGIALADLTRPGGGQPDGVPDLLVANRFGDLLVLAGTGRGSFAVPRPDLRETPLAVTDLNGDGLADVVLANQALDHVTVVFREPGTKTFSNPQLVDSSSLNQALLAPGAVQLVDLDGDTVFDLVVASSLANQVLVYRGLGEGQFATPISYETGTQPVAVVASDVTGDGVVDLVVANKGSNDVSVFLGQVEDGTWSATSGPRLNSGGQGPLGVDVLDQNGDGVPDLVVTNSSGQIATLAGIAAGAQGTGFFQDVNPPTLDIGQSVLTAANNFLATSTGVVQINPLTFTITPVINQVGIITLTVGREGGLLVTALGDGRVQLLERGGDGLFDVTGTLKDPLFEVSALEILESNGAFELYLTQQGNDVPRLFAEGDFTSLVSVPPDAPIANPDARTLEALAANLANVELALAAVLVVGPSRGRVVPTTTGDDPQTTDVDSGGAHEPVSKNVDLEESSHSEEPLERAPAWEVFRLGLDEAFERLFEDSDEERQQRSAEPEEETNEAEADSRPKATEENTVEPATDNEETVNWGFVFVVAWFGWIGPEKRKGLNLQAQG